MALTSDFYDGYVTETTRAQNRAGTPDYGVYGADDFKVSAHPSIPYALNVKAGKAHGFGVTDTAATDQTVQADSMSSGTRFDLVVVRRNWQPLLGGPSTLVVIKGGATVPDIQKVRKIGPGIEDDQPLALLEWRGNVNTPHKITDLRCWAANGGMVAADNLARAYLAKPGADVLIAGTTWRYALGANGVWSWVDDTPTVPAVHIGQGSRQPVFKSKEVAVKLNAYLVGDIVFESPFPVALVSISLERRHTTAGPVAFTIISGQTNKAKAQFVASGATANSTLYVTYQAWGY